MSGSTASRPDDVLPDHLDRIEVDGLTLRKGTVAAFLRNAIRWTDPATTPQDREALAAAIVEAVPALRALGLLAIFEARDSELRRLIAGVPDVRPTAFAGPRGADRGT